MAKNKLSKREKSILIINFFRSFSAIRTDAEAAEFLKDLLTPTELDILAIRLKIARLLLKGKTYEEIAKILKVGFGTIAKINEWLKIHGEGFRKVLKNIDEFEDTPRKYPEPYSFDWIRKKYPAHFGLINFFLDDTSSERKKEKLLSILEKIKEKPALFKKIDREYWKG